MSRNMSNTDRITRVFLSVALAYVYFGGLVDGILSVFLLMAGSIILVTSFVGFCPLYTPFNFSTLKNQ